MGGSAILLSNQKQAQNESKYQINLITRAQRAYKCAFREEDSNGFTGVTISRDVQEVFAEMLHDHLFTLGLLIWPTLEKLKFVTSIVRNKYLIKQQGIMNQFQDDPSTFYLAGYQKASDKEDSKRIKYRKERNGGNWLHYTDLKSIIIFFLV